MYAGMVEKNQKSYAVNIFDGNPQKETQQPVQGTTIEGVVVGTDDGVTIDFGDKTVKFSSDKIKDAQTGQTRSFEVVQTGSEQIVLREKTQTMQPARGVQTTQVNSTGGALFTISAQDITDNKNSVLYENIEGFLEKEDFKALEEEHESPLEKYNSERLERAVERIKRNRRARAESVLAQREKLDMKAEQAAETAEGQVQGMEAVIADRLKEAGIPATEDNIERISNAIKRSECISDMSAAAKNYIIKNGQQATIDNLYKASHSAAYIPAVDTAVYEELKTGIVSIIEQAGLENNNYTQGIAKEFLAMDIPLTEENFRLREKLDNLSELSVTELVEFAAESVYEGNEPDKAVLTGSTKSDVKAAVQAFGRISDAAVYKAAGISQDGSSKINLELLVSCEAAVSEMEADRQGQVYSSEARAAAVTVRRQLEEIRLKLTIESGMRLSGLGIEIDTAGLEEIVEGLRELENSYYKKLLGGTEGTATDDNIELVRQINESVDRIAGAPADILAATFSSNVNITVSQLAAEAETVTAEYTEKHTVYSKAVNSYEAVMTRPDKEYGDSISKAFGNVSSILASLGLEESEANKRAVRILGYNSIDINAENIGIMKYYDASVREMVDLMKPEITAAMVKAGINPLNMTVAQVSEAARTVTGGDTGVEEKYSSYLVKLEKSGGISEEEKKAYIGIYRLLYQVEKSDGAAVGAVVNAGKQLTLANLLEAVRTKKAGSFDENILDGVKVRAGGYANDISLQINTAYADMLTSSLSQNIEPWKLAGMAEDVVGNTATDENTKVQEFTDRIMNTSVEKLNEELMASGAEASEEYIQNAYDSFKAIYKEASQAGSFLADYGVEDSPHIIEAAKELIGGTSASDIEGFETAEGIEAESLPVTGEELTGILKQYYDRLYEMAGSKLSDVPGAGDRQVMLMDASRMLYSARLAGELAGKGFYEIPVKTGDTVTNMNLTVIHNEESAGRVNVSVNTENGAVNILAGVNGDTVQCLVSAENVTALDVLKGKEELLLRALKHSEDDVEVTVSYTVDKNASTFIFRQGSAYGDMIQNVAGTTDTRRLFEMAADIIGVLAE